MKEITQETRVFIANHFIPSDDKSCPHSSYILKHFIQYATNIYMTEAEFNSLMIEMGYHRSPKGRWRLSFSPEFRKFLKKERYL